MTAVVDYGVGNLFSLLCSLNRIGEKAEVTGVDTEYRCSRKTAFMNKTEEGAVAANTNKKLSLI